VSDDKTEQPSEKKLEDAREKGQVPVSRDLARLCMLLAVAELCFATEPLWREALFALFETALAGIGRPFLPALGQLLSAVTLLLLAVVFLFWLLCSVVAVAAYWGQFGVLISGEAITPKFDKLNPVNGIKQLFAVKKLIELMLTVFKAGLIGWIVFNLVREQLPTILALSGGEPKDVFHGFLELLRSVFHTLVVVCLCLGAVDYGMQLHFHTKDLMMDMEEVKKEYKESEGDPMVKGQRKQLARQLAMSGPSAKTAKANAVVVNPTHFAVALLYQPEAGGVPLVLAKGRDDVAQAMILRARECGIPVIRHVWLARTLYASGRLDAAIPRASYEAVAYVYAVVAELLAADDCGREVELESDGEPPPGQRPGAA
jgi:type III secretion protein U